MTLDRAILHQGFSLSPSPRSSPESGEDLSQVQPPPAATDQAGAGAGAGVCSRAGEVRETGRSEF